MARFTSLLFLWGSHKLLLSKALARVCAFTCSLYRHVSIVWACTLWHCAVVHVKARTQ